MLQFEPFFSNFLLQAFADLKCIYDIREDRFQIVRIGVFKSIKDSSNIGPRIENHHSDIASFLEALDDYVYKFSSQIPVHYVENSSSGKKELLWLALLRPTVVSRKTA